MLATERARSMHGAARLLHRTQPSISQAIAALESVVDLSLVARGPSGATLTPAGRILSDRGSKGMGFLVAAAQGAGIGPAPLARLRQQVRDTQLQALTATVAGGTFSAAACRLGIAQPVVSRSMAHLAQLLGQPLWTRSGRVLEMTRAARELAAGYELLQSELRLCLDELREMRGIYDGQIRLGALPTARASWLPRSLERLLEHYPNITVTIMDGPYEEQLHALRHGRIDLILGALRLPGPGNDVMQEPIFNDTLSLVGRAGHPLARGIGRGRVIIDRKALNRYRWLLPPQGTPARDRLNGLLDARRLPRPSRVLECNSFLTIRELLLNSDSVAVVSTCQVASDVVRNRLSVLGPPLPRTSQPVGWTMRTSFKPTAALRKFLDTARVESTALDRGSRSLAGRCKIDAPYADLRPPFISAVAPATSAPAPAPRGSWQSG